MMRLTPHHHVILADDDRDNRQRLTRLFRDAGYEVHPAADARDALELLERRGGCLVLSDWNFAAGGGRELCRAARRRYGPHELFILMLLGDSLDGGAQAVMAQMADDFVCRPAQDGELLARLQAGLRVLDLQQELHAARQAAAANLVDLAARADEIAATRDVAVFALAKLAESRDPETGEHLERLRSYSQILAEELHDNGPYRELIDEVFLEDLYRSSPLHDIGKVGIPDAILRKPGRLTPEEFEIMKQHTTIGAEALESAVQRSGCGGFLDMAVDIARYHHERFDGSGYPHGLRERQIPLSARIVALADVYDALTSVRVYKDAFAPEVARTMILEQEGRHFDPVVVGAFKARFADFLQVRSDVAMRAGTLCCDAVPMAG